ncbi:MAG: type II toxin-antitoxin system VapC family toxin [Solirubrobacterales bacterium]
MIVLDTNVISELTRQESDEHVVAWTERQAPSELWITSTTVSEIRLGMELMPRGRRRQTIEDVNHRVLASFEDDTLSFETRAAEAYSRIVSERARVGKPISRDDAQIAASCVAAGATLATRNTRDFEGIEGLQLINPFDPS